MSKKHSLPFAPLLNRLALHQQAAPHEANVLDVLEEVFEFASLQDMRELFGQFCQAALTTRYSWKEGSPGNLLYFIDMFEILIEASFLVQLDPKRQHQKRNREAVQEKPEFPANFRLSRAERKEPLRVLEVLFKTTSLLEHKQQLQRWREAAFSNYSITDSADPGSVLHFFEMGERLLEAAFLVLMNNRS